MRASARGDGDSGVPAGAGRLPAAGKRLLAALWLAVLLFTVGMIAAGWPRYWIYVAAETTPQAWLESVLLVLAAAVAGLNAFAASLERGNAGALGERSREAGEKAHHTREAGTSAQDAPTVGRRGRGDQQLADVRSGARGARLSVWIARHGAWGWTITAAAFAWLSLDERFALHERLRDRYLKQTGIRLLPWMEAGDWLIPLYAVCGLAAVWALWRLLGKGRAARAFFAAGLVLAFCAVSMDTIDIRSLGKSSERLLQTIEECLETAAMTAFASAFLSVLTGRLSAWYNKASIRRDIRDGDAG
ncbi:hypothetical protein SAMN05216312_101751 [Cohnella sp. OV330]|uniref:hypothetical protein n=1 Tax=Cohnella sp. OV330 TaxID=1855288 RepID=UPI0008EC199C|nr:hypothetical protein [Cohnella sp. OV330]SFA83023.1 hypothetical protein SAMN05216312_101751 [Cohnella sp. OV330]